MKENTLPKKNLRNKAHYRSFFLLVCLVMSMTNKDLKRTHVHHGLHYRSLFLLALLGLFFTEIHAVPNVPSGFTEISSEYDNFDNFGKSEFSADYTTSGGWSNQTSGSETGNCAYKKTLSAGDYVGKNMHLTAGTYIFSYYIKIANAKPTTLKLCWDTSDFTKSSQEFTLNTSTPGPDPGLSYESGEFTVPEGDYQLCTYVVSCKSGETKLRVDGFYLYQKNAPLVAHSTTFKDLYWNRSDSLQVIAETTGGAGITTPNVTAPDSWNFYGWALGTSFEYDYSGDPTVLAPNSSFFPSMDTTYTAVYSTGDVDNLYFSATPHGVTLDTTHVSVDSIYIDDWNIMCFFTAADNYALPNAITITLNGDTLSPSNYRWERGRLELMGLQEGDYTFSIHGVVPVLATVSPSNESIGFGVDAYPTIHFSEPIQCNGVAIVDDASLQTVMTNSSFIDLLRITNTTTTSGVTQSQTPLSFTTTLSADSTTITIHPATPLQDYSLHFLTLSTYELSSLNGEKSVGGDTVAYFTTEATLPILATPTDLAITSIDNDSATLSWTAVADASTYSVERYPLYRNYPSRIETVSGSTSYRFPIASIMGDSLIFKVYAKGASGVSHDSERASCNFTATQLSTPSNITALLRDSSIVLSWDNVEHATNYSLKISNPSMDTTYYTTNPSYTFVNLTPNTAYNIKLTALNGVNYINSNAVWADQTTRNHFTIFLDAQNGHITPNVFEVCEGDTITLPMATHDLTDWSFAGWSTATTTYTTAPQTFVNNTYVPSANRTLFAVYKQGASIQGTQTITIDDSNIENASYDTHSFNVTSLKSDGSTGGVFGFEGYYFSTGNVIQINSTKTAAYFGNTDPISGLNSISITSTSTGSGDFDLYQLNSPATSAPASATPIGSLAIGSTQTFNFVPGQGDYFIATPHSGYGQISEIVINAEANIDNYVYNSNPVPPALIPITLEAGSGTVSGATSTVVDGYDHQETILIDAIPSDTNWSFVGWSATIVTNMDTLPDLVNTAFTPTKPITLYAVYQNNLDLKYYSIIPNSDLIITDDNDSTELHQGDSFTSIIVNKNKTLRINSNTHLKSLIINPGAHVNLDSAFSFSTGWLHFIGQDDNPSALSIPKDSVLNTQMDYTIVLTDNTRYHFFSLPYNCNFDDILVDGVNTLDNIGILEYEPGELANGHSDNWIDLEAGDILLSNVGYCIATDLTSSPTVTFTPASSTFNFTNDNNKTIELQTTTGTASTEYQGWSLVGSPYLDAMGSGLYRKPAGISFVSKPNFSDNCWTYTQTAIGDATIEAFSSYFVQVGETTDMTFEFPTSYVSGGPLLKEDRLKLSLSNLAGETDPTYIDVQTQYTTDYEIGRDLRKMLGQGTRPQFFSLSGQEQRAFNAIPETAMNNIPLGIYTGTTDQYTITADNATRYNATHLYLTDLLTQVTTDLMISPYTFAGTAHTLNTSRFVLNIERNNVPTTCDPTKGNGLLIYAEQGQLSIQNLVLGSQLDIIDATGKIVYHRNVTSTSLNLKAATGLYIIRITLHDGSFTSYKTIL